jgi:hypothetical protein
LHQIELRLLRTCANLQEAAIKRHSLAEFFKARIKSNCDLLFSEREREHDISCR